MDDDILDSPPVVIGAISAGVAPLPFLAVYATLFIAHGSIQPVIPPDITTTKHGELVAGLITLAILVVMTMSIWWFLNGRRRWLFVLGQAATLGTAIDFVLDRTTGSPIIPILLLVTSATALVLAALPPSWEHMRSQWWRRRVAQRAARVPSGQASDGGDQAELPV